MVLKKCSECPLDKYKGESVTAWKGSQRVGKVDYREVPYRGPRDGADIIIVGECPTGYEIYTKNCLTGEVGDLVNAELRSYPHINPKHIFYANACRCLLHKEDKTSKKVLREALACCRPMLVKAIRHLKPKVIVCFGDVALYQVTGQAGITKSRGRLLRSEEFDCWVFPTFHPAACIRDAGKFAFWRPDMAYIAELAKNKFEAASGDAPVEYKDVESIQFILDQKNITVALDTETQGKDWTDYQNSVVISYSITPKEGTGYNVWLCWEIDKESQSATDTIIKWPRKSGRSVDLVDVHIRYADNYEKKINELRELCLRPDIKIVMQNGNYDLHRLRQLGINRDEVKSYCMDIQLGAHALDPDNFIKAGLTTIQTSFMNNREDHKTSFKESADITDMLASSLEDPERHTMYSCADTDITYSCATAIRAALLKDKKLANYYVQLAHPVQSIVLYEIEKNGIPFDLAKISEVKERIAGILRKKEDDFFELIPSKVIGLHEEAGLKLTRARFIRDVLFSKAGFNLPVMARTPSGEPTIDRKILTRLRESMPDCQAKDALSVFIEWGPYQKLYSTYLKGFEAAVKNDGRLHTQITKAGTATGRSSSSNPNLQNIPKRNKEIMGAIRSLLYAPEGKMLVAVDYSQSELRWIAHESMDRTMLNLFKNGEDMHVITAKSIAAKRGSKWEDLNEVMQKKYRQDAKPINFGFPYGQSAHGFQTYAQDNYGVKFSLSEAELYRNTFLHESYPGLLGWHQRRIQEAKKFGFVRSEFGFIRRTPNISSGDNFRRGEDERIAVNTGIQSASNDTTLLGALEARRVGLVDDDRVQLVLFIHDELVYMVDEDYVDYFTPRIIEHLENIPTEKFGFKMRVPLIAEATVGKILSDMKPYIMKQGDK
jgi:uracil-DNA glycosylase family 4